MGKKNRNQKNGQGSGSDGPTSPQTTGKRPLSNGSPDSVQNVESKRQRGGSDGSVFDTMDEGAGVGSEVGGGGVEGLDRERLTSQLMAELDKAIHIGKPRAEGGREATGSESEVMDDFLKKVLPVFLNFVIDKVADIFKQPTPNPQPANDIDLRNGIGDMQALCARLKYENDNLEQYSRRESIRIFGIPEVQGEDAKTLETKVLKVLNDTGATIHAHDISVMHRLGKRGRTIPTQPPNQGQGQSQTQGQGQGEGHGQGQGGDDGQDQGEGQPDGQQNVIGGRPVIVRFVARSKKMEVMIMKKNLKNKDGYRHIFMHEDITRLRSKLLHYVKNLPNIGRTWTKDGQIFCKRKGPNNTVVGDPIGPIENADHLFHFFGVVLTSQDVRNLGLEGYVFLQ